MPEAVSSLRDIRPPVDWPAGFPWWLILIVVTAASLAALGYFLYGRYHRRPKTPKPIRRPPSWDTALSQLRELKAEDLPGQGRVKEYFIRLSAVVRRYTEERFSIRAPEMTSEEFLDSLRHSPVLDPSQKQAVREFLTCCDMVKFARYDSNPREMQKSFDLAERLIEQTRPAQDAGPAAS